MSNNYNRNPESLSMVNRIKSSYEAMYYGVKSNDPHVDAQIKNSIQDRFGNDNVIIAELDTFDDGDKEFLNDMYKKSYMDAFDALQPNAENKLGERASVGIEFNNFVSQNDDFTDIIEDRYEKRYNERPDMISMYYYTNKELHPIPDRIKSSYEAMYYGVKSNDPDTDDVIKNSIQDRFGKEGVTISELDTESLNDMYKKSYMDAYDVLQPNAENKVEERSSVGVEFNNFVQQNEDFANVIEDRYEKRYNESPDKITLYNDMNKESKPITDRAVANNDDMSKIPTPYNRQDINDLSATERHDFDKEMARQNALKEEYITNNLDEYNRSQENQAINDGFDIWGNNEPISQDNYSVAEKHRLKKRLDTTIDGLIENDEENPYENLNREVFDDDKQDAFEKTRRKGEPKMDLPSEIVRKGMIAKKRQIIVGGRDSSNKESLNSDKYDEFLDKYSSLATEDFFKRDVKAEAESESPYDMDTMNDMHAMLNRVADREFNHDSNQSQNVNDSKEVSADDQLTHQVAGEELAKDEQINNLEKEGIVMDNDGDMKIKPTETSNINKEAIDSVNQNINNNYDHLKPHSDFDSNKDRPRNKSAQEKVSDFIKNPTEPVSTQTSDVNVSNQIKDAYDQELNDVKESYDKNQTMKSGMDYSNQLDQDKAASIVARQKTDEQRIQLDKERQQEENMKASESEYTANDDYGFDEKEQFVEGSSNSSSNKSKRKSKEKEEPILVDPDLDVNGQDINQEPEDNGPEL